jgi:hypothetical protein
MILELTNKYNQINLEINKENHILMYDYKGYLKLYNYFYETLIKKNNDYEIRLSNKKLDIRNTIMFDFTSISNILTSLEFKKGTLIYEYFTSKYSEIDEIGSDRLYEIFGDIKDYLNKNDSDIYYEINNNLDKMLYEGIETLYNIENIYNVFTKVITNYFNITTIKTIIIFINSEIFNYNYNIYENIYYFDISKKKNIYRYNLISTDVIKELNINILKNELIKVFPYDIDINYLEKTILLYFKLYIFFNRVIVYSEKDYILFYLLSKYNNINKKIVCVNFIINNNIKSYLAQL